MLSLLFAIVKKSVTFAGQHLPDKNPARVPQCHTWCQIFLPHVQRFEGLRPLVDAEILSPLTEGSGTAECDD